MYDRKTSGWMKHLDFIFLDLMCLLSAYMLAYFLRHGEDSILYWNGSYTALLLVISCSDVMLSILFNPFHDVLRNTAGKDLAAGLKLDIGITACTTLYLYLAQEGFWISRMVLILTFTVYPCLSFLMRTVYKRWIRKAKKSIGKKSLLIISDEHFDSNTYQDILLFVPFGFLLPMVERKADKIWKAAATGFCLSIGIEFVQYIFALGQSETDDVIMNTAGAAFGYGIYRFAERRKA